MSVAEMEAIALQFPCIQCGAQEGIWCWDYGATVARGWHEIRFEIAHEIVRDTGIACTRELWSMADKLIG